MSAVSAIDGLVFSGSAIRAVLFNKNTTVESIIGHEQGSTSPYSAHISSHKTHLNTDRFVLYLENLLTASDVADEEEVQEVLADLHTLCGTCLDRSDGAVSRLWIERRATPAGSSGVNETLSAVRFSPMRVSCSASGLPWVLVECPSLSCALRVRDRLHGLVVGGNAVQTDLYDHSAYLLGDYQEELLSKELVVNGSSNSSYAVRLVGFVETSQVVVTSADGVEEESDEKEEVLSDISSLVGEWCGDGVRLGSVVFTRPSPVVDASSGPSDDAMDVFLVLGDVQQASTLSAALSSRVVGGQRLVAEVVMLSGEHHEHGAVFSSHNHGSATSSQPSNSLHFRTLSRSGETSAVVVVRGYLSAEDLSAVEDGDQDLVTAKRDLLLLARGGEGQEDDQQLFVSRLSVFSGDGETCDASEDGDAFVACLEFECALSAERVMVALDGSVVGGRRLCAYLEQVSGSLVVQATHTDIIATVDLNPAGESLQSSEAPSALSTSTDISCHPEGHSCLYYEQFSPAYAPIIPPGGAETLLNEEVFEGESLSKYAAAKGAPKLALRTRAMGSYKVRIQLK
jgi:hypothetical protein